MGRNIGSSGAKVPDDPLWIDIPRSDGHQRYWPTNTTYIEDGGEINWMKLVDLDDDVALRWRLQVGNRISIDSGSEGQDHSRAILRAWPAGYRMYDHHKGKVNAPRHDIYLYGPQFKRFRSINEFVPHAIWLCRDETMNTQNCCCKYCKKLPQKVISSALDSIIQASSSQMSVSAPPRSHGNNAAGPSSGTPAVQGRDIYSALQKQGWVSRERVRDSTSLAQRKAQREQRVKQSKGKRKDESAPKVFASVQKQLQPMKELRPSDNVSDMPMLADRNRDLRAVYSRSANDKMGVLGWDDDSEAALTSQAVQWGVTAPPAQPNKGTPSLRRYYRENEIVWVQLPGQGIPVASLGSTQEMNISIWPGMIKGSKIKNTPIPVSQPSQGGIPPQGKPPSSTSPINATLNGHIRSVPATSSAGVAGNSDPPLASGQLPPSTSSFHPESSSGSLSALPGPSHLAATNGLLSSSTPFSSTPGLPPTGVSVSNTASPAPNAVGGPVPSLPSRAHHAVTPTTSPSNSGSRPENSGDWIVRESIVYTIQLSGLDVRVEVPAAGVLPYLATAPADDFVAWLKLVHDYLNFEDDSIRHFDPMDASRRAGQDGVLEEEAIKRASQAISAYALALQTASHVCNDWSLTDKWDFEYVPPAYEKGPVRVNVASKNGAVQSTPVSSPPLPLPSELSTPMKTKSHTFISGLSLASAIQDAGRANAQGPTSFSQNKMDLNATTGSRPVYMELSGTSDLMTEQEVRDIAEGVLGVGPGDAPSASSVPEALIQVRFQGMWWGSERIWVDDFVRVKVPRGALAPNGAPNVYKPSGWGRANKDVASKLKALQQARIESGSDKGKGREGGLDSLEVQEVHSVGSRGIFMKVGGIFVVDVPKPDGNRKKEGRICGMLYELAELDWDETEPELKDQYELEKKQREVYLEQANGTTDPVAFKASVDESLLPSNPGKPRSLWTSSSVQPSPPPHYIMPQAPKGYRFRPILKTGCEAVLNLSLIAGRYYPRIIGHPLLAPKFTQELSAPKWDLNEKQRTDLMSSMSLEGLSAGHYNAVDPQYHKKSRTQMLDDAERGALRDMDRFKREMWAAYSQASAEVEYSQEDDEMGEGDSEDDIVEMEMDELAMNVD